MHPVHTCTSFALLKIMAIHPRTVKMQGTLCHALLILIVAIVCSTHWLAVALVLTASPSSNASLVGLLDTRSANCDVACGRCGPFTAAIIRSSIQFSSKLLNCGKYDLNYFYVIAVRRQFSNLVQPRFIIYAQRLQKPYKHET